MSIGKRPIKELVRLRPFLGKEFENFVLRGTRILYAPVEDLLWGFHFDARSGHENSRWIYASCLPLLGRIEFAHLSYGRRIPDGRHMGHDAFPVSMGTTEELKEVVRIMRTEGFAELKKWNSPSAFRRSLAADEGRVFSIHSVQAGATLAAREEDFGDAIRIISDCETYLCAVKKGDLSTMLRFDSYAREGDQIDPWVPPVFDDLVKLKKHCLAGDVKATQALLNEWRAYTISQLGIEDICVPMSL